ncbi:major facilitator superfamily-domain-containing protein [Daldinia sp. FL1419]|nr:major facilitator superfamily-domain-containing protein [Daldinia sp. FL1419]
MTANGYAGIGSSASSATAAPVTSQENVLLDEAVELPRDGAMPSQPGRTSDRDGSFVISQAGTQSPNQDDSWTSSDEKERGERREDDQVEEEKGTKSQDLEGSNTNVSIAQTLSLPREIVFVFVICLAQLFTQCGLGQTISIIHTVGDHFGISNPGELSWFMAGYSLTIGTFILFSGRLGDVFGHKTMYLVGMGWYSIWTTVCGLSVYSNHVLFIFARVLQGIGPAIILPNGLAILGVTYPPGRRKEMIFAIFGAMAPTGSVIGSLFAAILTLAWWPWAYWAFGIVLAATVVIGYFVIPEASNIHHTRPKGFINLFQELDVVGTVLGVTGLVLVNFSWNQAPVVGWDKPYVYVLLIVGMLVLAAFFVFEVKFAQHPLIPFKVLSSEVSFVLGAIACGWSCFGIWFFYSWEFLLVLRRIPPLLATAMFVPTVIAGVFAALFTGYSLHRLKPPMTMTIALACFTIGIIILATCPVDQIYWGQFFVSGIIMPWGMDMSFPAGTLILSDAVPRKHQGIAASLVNTVVNYSISLGLGFAGTVETQVNKGGETPADILKGYRGAYYMGIGLASLGLLVCVAFVTKSRSRRNATSEDVP